MSFIENIRLAFTSLKSNKMRSILTMLGIIIGIMSVIAIMTVGNGMTVSINDSLSSLGATNITVYVEPKSATIESRINSPEMTDEDYITDSMIASLKERFASKIEAVAISNSVAYGSVSEDDASANVSLMGVNDDYIITENLKLISGRSFVSRDTEGARSVAMVSDKFAEKLFGSNYNDAIGQEISISSGSDYYDLLIIGVYEYESNVAPISQVNEDDIATSVYIPLSTASDLQGESLQYSSITVKCYTGVDGTAFAEEIGTYLNKYYENNQNYQIATFTMESMIEEMNSILGMVSLALAVIAGISLLVGGIGVMNIMLVSVSERTREIGTRKAMGATNADIRLQFVTESIIVCLVGGFIGIVLGGLLGYFASGLIGAASYPTLNSILIAFGFSLIIGVFFGYYPANRAAKLNPIDALRYE